MADAVARWRYAGETRPVEIKQKIEKGSAAHPELVEAKNETGRATVTRVDGDSGHGAANFVGNGVSVTAVSKTTKQEQIKHHSVEMKL